MATAIPLDTPPPTPMNMNMNILLLTQNIGSIECSHENEVHPENKEKVVDWTRSVAAFLEIEQERVNSPMDLVVIHLQEIGGKKFNAPFNEFLQSAVRKCYPEAAWCSGLLAPLENDNTSFTAMGTVIFLSERAANLASLWSFRDEKFLSIQELINSPPQQLGAFYYGAKFSQAGSSRKGFLLTKLRLGNSTTWNFMNLHLFHDADNTVAASQPFPSEYAIKRAEALAEAMTKVSAVINIHQDPLFLFGDMNLRLDTNGVKAALEEQFHETIKLEKKIIQASQQCWDFIHQAQNWMNFLKRFDHDASLVQKAVKDKAGLSLVELPINFGPTYLLEDDPLKARGNECNEDLDKSTEAHGDDEALAASYKHERFPAWCDRVWYNATGEAAMDKETATYWNAKLHPMDHLPVYLSFQNSKII